MQCAFCGAKLKLEDRVSRRDTCAACGRDLRCCMQCKFYDPHAYNECREVSAERIRDKERSNFCDYFLPKGSKGGGGGYAKTLDAKQALEALFKKK